MNQTILALTCGTALLLSQPASALAASTLKFGASLYQIPENSGDVQLTVTRTGDVGNIVTVDYATTNGTATAGHNYTETKGTLSFAAGELTKTLVVQILNNGIAEKDKQFKVVLSNPTGGMALGAAGNITATVTVCDVSEMLPHRFDAVQVSLDGLVTVTLGGGFTPGLGLSNRFQPYVRRPARSPITPCGS